MKTLLSLLLLLLPILAQGQTPQIPATITVRGTEFTGCRYTRHDAAFLYFTHESGIARIEIAKLPDDLKATLGFDPAKAEATKADENRKQAASAQTLAASAQTLANAEKEKQESKKIAAESRLLFLAVQKVLPEGLYCRKERTATPNADGSKIQYYDWHNNSSGPFFILLTNGPTDVVNDDLIICLAYQSGIYTTADSNRYEKWKYLRPSTEKECEAQGPSWDAFIKQGRGRTNSP